MVTVLVTGVAGFMGSHVAEHCQAHGFDVVGFDDLSGGFERNIPPGVAFVEGSVSDHRAVERLFAEHGPFTYVYHLAAYAAEGLSHFIRRFNYTNNVVGSVNIINECIKGGVECLVFTSSIAVYGQNQTPMTESMTPQPEDPYGVAKYAVELDLRAAQDMFGLNAVIFRPHNVYGERQNIADRYRNVVGIFMNQVMQDQPMTVFGDGQQTRAFSHVDDVAPIIARAPLVPAAHNEVFNIGADEPHSVLELATTVAQAFDVEPRIRHLDPRVEVVHAFADHDKVRRVFGTGDPLDLEAGVARMAQWARTVGSMPPVTFEEVEVDRNIPPSWRASASGSEQR